MSRLFYIYAISTGKGEQPRLVTILEKPSLDEAFSHAKLYYGDRNGPMFVKPVRYGQHETARQYIADRKRKKKG